LIALTVEEGRSLILLRAAFVGQQDQTDGDQDDGIDQVEVFPTDSPVRDQDAAADQGHDPPGNERPPLGAGKQGGQHGDEEPAKCEADQEDTVLVREGEKPAAFHGQDAQADPGQDATRDDSAGAARDGAPGQHAQAKQQDDVIPDVQPALQQGGEAEEDQDDSRGEAVVAANVDFLFKVGIHICLRLVYWTQGYPSWLQPDSAGG
jgi:hypothetical protein